MVKLSFTKYETVNYIQGYEIDMTYEEMRDDDWLRNYCREEKKGFHQLTQEDWEEYIKENWTELACENEPTWDRDKCYGTELGYIEAKTEIDLAAEALDI